MREKHYLSAKIVCPVRQVNRAIVYNLIPDTFTHTFFSLVTGAKKTAQAHQISRLPTFRSSAEQIGSEQIFYRSLSSTSVPKPSQQLNCRLKSSWALFRSPSNSKFFHSLFVTSIFSRLHGVLNVGKKNN